jgi:hypothetical protein
VNVQGVHWVATEIVMTPNPKQRAIVLQRFIEIAEVRASITLVQHPHRTLIGFVLVHTVLLVTQQLQRDDPDHNRPRVSDDIHARAIFVGSADRCVSTHTHTTGPAL